MINLPFSPKRRNDVPILCGGLSITLIVLLAFATWMYPPKTADLWPFAGIWASGGTLVLALRIVARAKLTFYEDGFERISGLRRQFVNYDSIARIEWRRCQGKFGPVQLLEIRFKQRIPVIEIWRDDYITGELEKIAKVLRERATDSEFERNS